MCMLVLAIFFSCFLSSFLIETHFVLVQLLCFWGSEGWGWGACVGWRRAVLLRHTSVGSGLCLKAVPPYLGIGNYLELQFGVYKASPGLWQVALVGHQTGPPEAAWAAQLVHPFRPLGVQLTIRLLIFRFEHAYGFLQQGWHWSTEKCGKDYN